MPKLLMLPLLIALVSCTMPSDSFVTQRLTALSNSTDAHFEHLILSFGTDDCLYSSAPNQEYWASTTSSMQVLDIRLQAFSENSDLVDGVNSLSAVLESLRTLEAEAEAQTSGVRCLEPSLEVAQFWPQVSAAFDNIIAASSTDIVR